MINRVVQLPRKQSFFLFGPRQTGKSTLIKSRFPKGVWKVDLLSREEFIKYSKDPSLFRREAEKQIRSRKIRQIFVDEIQRLPELLNDIQYLMGQHPDCQFILSGSSARKLRRGGANLLGGRAVLRYLFPFTWEEIKEDFDLSSALHFGTLPAVYEKSKEEKIDTLTSYSHVYLQEEIKAEGIARNLGGFMRFLDLAASQFTELVSFSAIGRECYLPVRTVQSYYEILEDTLIGFRLESWQKSLRKRLVAHPKFYFFDCGVTNAINRRLEGGIDPQLKGRLFEQWVVLETFRAIHYKRSEARIFFWRTNNGAEVDLLIEKHGRFAGAFEIKSARIISGADLSGLRSFREEHPKVSCSMICTAENAYEIDGVQVLPWKEYLESLHNIL